MNKNKLKTSIVSAAWGILTILLIFLIFKTNKLQYNIELITWEDLIDITPIQKDFDLTLFQNSLIENIKKTEISIVWIYEQRDIELLNENSDKNLDNYNETQTTNIETIKTLQWNWIIISNDWYVITNKHVVENLNSKYTISLNNKNYDADKIRFDVWLDIAIIKIRITEPVIPARIIDISNNIDIWQIVFALKKDPEVNETITKMGIINSPRLNNLDDNRFSFTDGIFFFMGNWRTWFFRPKSWRRYY